MSKTTERKPKDNGKFRAMRCLHCLSLNLSMSDTPACCTVICNHCRATGPISGSPRLAVEYWNWGMKPPGKDNLLRQRNAYQREAVAI